MQALSKVCQSEQNFGRSLCEGRLPSLSSMAGETSQFFNPWESPPRFTSPPEDTALEKRIAKLAEYCVRIGPSFIGIFKQKQQDNQEYAFLSGGEGAEYWRWVRYILIAIGSHGAGMWLPSVCAWLHTHIP